MKIGDRTTLMLLLAIALVHGHWLETFIAFVIGTAVNYLHDEAIEEALEAKVSSE